MIGKASAALATPGIRPGRGTGTAAIAPPVHPAGSSVAPTTRGPKMVGRLSDVTVRGSRDLEHRAGLVRVDLVVPLRGHAVRRVMAAARRHGDLMTVAPAAIDPGGSRTPRMRHRKAGSGRDRRDRPVVRSEVAGRRTEDLDPSTGSPGVVLDLVVLAPAVLLDPTVRRDREADNGSERDRGQTGSVLEHLEDPTSETRGRGTRRGTPSSGGRRRRSSSWSPRTKSSWQADDPSKRRSSRDGRPDGCSSSRSDGRHSSGSSCMRRAFEFPSLKSRAEA